MLQGDRSARGDARQLRVLDHRLAVEVHSQAVAFHRDDHAVPLPDGFVGDLLGRDAAAHFRGHLWIGAIAVHFTGADRPAPDIHLALARAAEIDPAIAGVEHFDLFLLAVLHRI